MKDIIRKPIRAIRRRAGPLMAIAMALFGMALPSRANEIHWVGYQFGPAAGSLPNFSTRASFFHGDQWLNYVVPGAADLAVFDTTFDLQQNGMSHDVYFGDFTMPVVPIYNPNSFLIPGGNALLDRLTVRNGDFRFLFIDELGTPHGSVSTRAQMSVADVADADASLTILNGRLTTGFVAHIASGVRSIGAIEVDGPGAEWIHSSYIDLGWVGDGRLTVKNGAHMESAGRILAGIRNGSAGALEILSGGQVVARDAVLIGNGHEGTGLARGQLLIDGAGSHLTARSLGVGGVGGAGTALLSRGGRAEVAEGVNIFSVASRSSEIHVSNANSLLQSGGGLVIEGDGAEATLRADEGAAARFANVSLNPNDSRPIGQASLVAKSDGVVAIRSTLTLRDRNGPSIVDAAGSGRIEIGTLMTPAVGGEIRVGAGGSLIGSGTILGNLTVEAAGSVSPGFSPGHLVVGSPLLARLEGAGAQHRSGALRPHTGAPHTPGVRSESGTTRAR